MSDPLFFIDTNPEDAKAVEKKDRNKSKHNGVLDNKKHKDVKTWKGKKDKEKKLKLQETREKEENLSAFLFGNNTKADKDDLKVEKKVEKDNMNTIDDDYVSKKLKEVKKKAKKEAKKKQIKEENKEPKKEKISDDVEEEIPLKSGGGSEDKESEDETPGGDNVDQKEDLEKTTDKENDGGSESEGSSEEESSDEEADESTNVFDLIPEDTLSANLNMAGSRKRKAAWHDEADAQVLVKDGKPIFRRTSDKQVSSKTTSTEKYSVAVQRKFKGIVGEPAWASLDNKDTIEEDSDDEFFQETTDLIDDKGKSSRLPKGILDFRPQRDMNTDTRNEGAIIRCLDFHPTSTVGLVSGLQGTTSIMQIDGKNNSKIQTVNFQDFLINTARFSMDGNEIIVGSKLHKHFFVFDMIAGKIIKKTLFRGMFGIGSTKDFELSPDGKIMAIIGLEGAIQLFSARNKQYIGNLQMNDRCRSMAFSKSGRKLYTIGDGGEFYTWDMNSRTCESKLVDEGCLRAGSIAVNSNYLASGSYEGVVNIYSLSKLAGMKTGNPKPDKTVLNLTTTINDLKFNPTGEILAMSSILKDDAIRLLHFPSMTVFENFPTLNPTKSLHKVSGVTFSPGGGYMAFGNSHSRAPLYRLNHYKDY